MRLVNVSPAECEEPVLDTFLGYLARDMARHPEHMLVFPRSLLDRARALTDDIPIDHDEPIHDAMAI